MKIENLKSYFLKRLTKSLSALVIVCVAWFSFYFVSDFYNQKRVAYQQKDTELTSQLSNVKNQISKAKATLIVWTKLVDNNFSITGLKIQAAKKIIDDLRQYTFINNLNISLSSPIVRKDISKNLVSVEYSELNLDFDSYTDVQAFKFIDGLNKQLPGMLNYNSLTITSRDVSIDDKIVSDIQDGQYKDLIKVRLSLIWQDITATSVSSTEGQK